jgi:flavin-binding protein dodecin
MYGGGEYYPQMGCECRGRRHEGGFFNSLMTGLGIGVLASALMSLFKGKNAQPAGQVIPTAQTVASKQIQTTPQINNISNASNKYEQFSNWELNNITNQNNPNLQFVNPEFRTLMDKYHQGGSKDEELLNKALKTYTNNVLDLGIAEVAKYDTDQNGSLDYTEFLKKSLTEAKRDFSTFKKQNPDVQDEFNENEAIDAAQNAFKHLSHDGKTITAKDFAAMYALADKKTAGHEGKCKGDISPTAYEEVENALGKPNKYKNDKGSEIKNEVGSEIKDAYKFFFEDDSATKSNKPVKLNMQKGEGFTQALKEYLVTNKVAGGSQITDESLAKAVNTLRDIQAQRIKDKKTKIFQGATSEYKIGDDKIDKNYWQKHYVVNTKTIEFTGEEFAQIEKAIGLAQ